MLAVSRDILPNICIAAGNLSPRRGLTVSPGGARYPSEYLKVLVLTLPNWSPAFTCRYTVQLWYISIIFVIFEKHKVEI